MGRIEHRVLTIQKELFFVLGYFNKMIAGIIWCPYMFSFCPITVLLQLICSMLFHLHSISNMPTNRGYLHTVRIFTYKQRIHTVCSIPTKRALQQNLLCASYILYFSQDHEHQHSCGSYRCEVHFRINHKCLIISWAQDLM